MRGIICTLLITLLVLTNASTLPLLAQNPNGGQASQSHPNQDDNFKHRLPPQARPGSTAERRAAWERLSPAEREKALAKFNEILDKARKRVEERYAKEAKNAQRSAADEPVDTSILVTDRQGNRQFRSAKDARKGQAQLSQPLSFIRINNSGQQARSNIASRRNARPSVRPELSAHHSAPHRALNSARAQDQGVYAYAQTDCRSIEQFVRGFYQGALARQPYDYELQSWVGSLTQAQAQGQDAMVNVARNLGYTIFQSQEYVNRGRSDADYVYDLYAGFLLRGPDEGGYNGWLAVLPSVGRYELIGGFANSIEFWNLVTGLCVAGTMDTDEDGLPESFENQVADAFTPFYHVSAGEQDNFATFANTEDETVVQRFGQSVVSHFRVKPMGFGTDSRTGQLVSLIQVDYLTLWDHDSGNATGAECYFFSPALGTAVELINRPHDLDNERSAVLLAAPTTAYGVYNTNALDYSAYEFFTTGHEGVYPFDQTRYLVPGSPVPATGPSHINLWLSRSKHATYPFPDVNYFPQFQLDFIYEVYAGIDFECYLFDYDYWCFVQYYLADVLFFDCAVEHFSEQGGQYAFKRINVGEPRLPGLSQHPINGSEFISHNELYGKLTMPLLW